MQQKYKISTLDSQVFPIESILSDTSIFSYIDMPNNSGSKNDKEKEEIRISVFDRENSKNLGFNLRDTNSTIEPSFVNRHKFKDQIRRAWQILQLVFKDYFIIPLIYIFTCRIIPNKCKYGIFAVLYFSLIGYIIYTYSLVTN